MAALLPGVRRTVRRPSCARSKRGGVPGAGVEPAWGLPQGIFMPLQLSLLHARATHLWSGLYLCRPARPLQRVRIRQGPSSLYTFLQPQALRLSSVLQPP